MLIANLGTPDATDYWSMRRYLNQFLSDKRVIDYPRWKWQPILQMIILTLRPSKSGAAYRSIWNTEKDESPLLTVTRAQSEKIAAIMAQEYGDDVIVDFCMRYGNPSTKSVIQKMKDQGVDRIVFFPLYPQYSASTTASTFDAVAEGLMKQRWMPELRMINNYGADIDYINACAQQIQNYWQQNTRKQKVIFSFHGLPKRNLILGDPYHCECHETSRLIAEKLNLREEEWQLTFQSRFGKAEWLQPYTIKTMEQLPSEGIKSVDVFCPGFSADCLETLEEISMQNRDVYINAGGESFSYIPALNAEVAQIDALANIVMRHTQGWPETAAIYTKSDKETISRRAMELGAKQ